MKYKWFDMRLEHAGFVLARHEAATLHVSFPCFAL